MSRLGAVVDGRLDDAMQWTRARSSGAAVVAFEEELDEKEFDMQVGVPQVEACRGGLLSLQGLSRIVRGVVPPG